jgi:Uma2 family endonuclease
MGQALKTPTGRMTAEQFLAWSANASGRHELVGGFVEVMQSERVEHAEVKANVYAALKAGIARANAPCHVLPDGMVVRATADDVFEPDAVVYCGARLSRGTLEVPNPVIVVEVLSPSTASKDENIKLASYFQLASVQHYLLIHPLKMPVVHFARQEDDTILTRLVHGGMIRLDPPGIEISVDGLLD